MKSAILRSASRQPHCAPEQSFISVTPESRIPVRDVAVFLARIEVSGWEMWVSAASSMEWSTSIIRSSISILWLASVQCTSEQFNTHAVTVKFLSLVCISPCTIFFHSQ